MYRPNTVKNFPFNIVGAANSVFPPTVVVVRGTLHYVYDEIFGNLSSHFNSVVLNMWFNVLNGCTVTVAAYIQNLGEIQGGV
jgi:hypothetical protein